ncbi:MAG: carbohydrate ABC transporter permease, partial [Ruminococcus sp.]
FVKFFCMLGRFFKMVFFGFVHSFANYGKRFIKGDWSTKASYLIMGTGNIFKGQYIKGFLFLLVEVAYVCFLAFFGLGYISQFGTLGTVEYQEYMDPATYKTTKIFGDDSLLLLLYGVVTIVVTIVFLVFYIINTKSAYNACQLKKNGEHLPTFREEIKVYLDEKFHITLLAVPTLLIGIFTILPLILMILMAFTNMDHFHQRGVVPADWVGLQTFVDVFSSKSIGGSSSASMGHTFLYLTQWTIIWAFFATFLNYFLGMIVALMINKKGIKLKALWRTLFVVTVAVPQFVTLLVMNLMLNFNDGAINILLENLGFAHVHFLDGTALTARITVIVVNLWVGIPYTILITSGILMNIPADLYESATIDGAGPFKSFTKITLPYMLFVTTPYLITTFINNINNFNVIYLLTAGGPTNTDLYRAGDTDLLVTWLFDLSMGSDPDYSYAAAIGILVFIVCASLSLITFNLTKSAKDEEAFS